MAGAQFTCPLIVVIPGQLITANLWNNEFLNIATNLNPSGIDGYMDTTTQAQIQTNPYPSSILNLAGSLGGELERIRYQISAMLGATTPAFWYAKPPIDLTTLSVAMIPVGGVFDYPSATPPSANYLLANGQAIGRTFYATLFALIGTTFGTGDGATTFNIPNYTDKMSIAAGNLYALAATGGATTHTLTASEIPASGLTVPITDPGHTHPITDPNHSHGVTDPGHTHVEKAGPSNIAGTHILANTNQASVNSPDSTASATTGLTVNSGSTGITGANSNTTGITATLAGGGGAAHNILNPYLAMYRMIRVL